MYFFAKKYVSPAGSCADRVSPGRPFQERRRLRFVVAAMVNPFTLPIVGASLLAAVAVGVHLGESSVRLIHPIHFQGPALHPRDRGVAIDESRLAPRPPAYGELYGWEEGRAARAADCGDCEALRARAAYARDYAMQVPYFAAPEVAVAEPAEVVVVPAGYSEAAAEEEMAPPVSKPPVARYAYYPVVAEEEAPEDSKLPPADDDYYR